MILINTEHKVGSIHDLLVEVVLKSGHLLLGDLNFIWDAVKEPIEKIHVYHPEGKFTFEGSKFIMFKEGIFSLGTGNSSLTLHVGVIDEGKVEGFAFHSNGLYEKKEFDFSQFHPRTMEFILK